ncbi:MAG: iron-only hydrogenase system regulator [Eubacteriales bacterium]|jgi:putative iron-only hydrogenase system regulator|nr:iron-only hydrogenase system regulator [Eubacteriales bacterium]
MKRVAVVSAILENPQECQHQFNLVVSQFKGIIKGRMGIPIPEANLSAIAITVIGELDEINHLTGKLGNIKNVTVKTSVSKAGVKID